jgi:ribonuclease H2 subunit A
MMGIDEAGRGPVLGNMTYGAALCPVPREQDTKNIGFVDSKKLDDKKRQVLFKKIKETDWLLWHVCSISPISISNAMMRESKKYSLNAMSHDCAIGMVKHFLNQGVNITQLYVDTVGIESYYQDKLQQLFPSMKIVVCKKCDDIYPICSAASICAKASPPTLMAVNPATHASTAYPVCAGDEG